MERGYYEILGVATTASPDEIRNAHRILVRRFHPDTAEDGEACSRQFSEVQEAYEALSNPDQRRRYDARMAILRDGEKSTKRHPPKTACNVCGKMVYATQRRLHLGRYMCQPCYEDRSKRVGKILHLMSLAELRWQLKALRVHARSHLASIVLVLMAIAFAGARFARMTFRDPYRTDAPTHSNPRTAAKPPTSSTSLAMPTTTPSVESNRLTSVDPR